MARTLVNTIDDSKFSKVGEVKHSMLEEAEFQAIYGTGWVLMDGRSVTGSDYETLTGNGNIPDARGRFLRSRDYGPGANPDGDQPQGTANGDKTRNPGFTYADTYMDYIQARYPRAGTFNGDMAVPRSGWSPIWQTGNGSGPPMSTQLRNSQSSQSVGGGNNETAPVNLIINTYIKINEA